MELKQFAPIFALLLAVGIIFGTYTEFTAPSLGRRFGFDWFLDMLWFVLGFTVLFVIGLLTYAAATKGEAKILEG